MADALAESLAVFSKRIYDEIKIDNGTDSNLIMSPFSISVALSMLYAGCDGKTKDQLKHALFNQYQKDDGQLHTNFSEIITAINTGESWYQLHVANRLYPNAHFVQNLLPEYVEKLTKFYRSDLKAVDFSKSVETCNEINRWANEKTHGKINNVLEPDKLSADTMLVIINAIYFKGNWLYKFDPQATQMDSFYQRPEQPIQLELMRMSNKKFQYTENEHFQLLGMPYEGDDLYMYIFLPQTQFSLSDLEKFLEPSDVPKAIEACRLRKVESLVIPKFKVETSVGLNDVLKRLGLTDMFMQDRADLSKINGGKNLFVSNVIHKAFIEVNEIGTEAAAVSAVEISTRSRPRPQPIVNFIANRPFMYVIYHEPLLTALFMGRFCGK